MSHTPLVGHTSPETAYVVQDYPYGFRLRCKIRYWVETTKHGQRVVSQTTNPKVPGRCRHCGKTYGDTDAHVHLGDNPHTFEAAEVWNKPKASTYSAIRVLYIEDSTGHVENAALNLYNTLAQIADFQHRYAPALQSSRDQKTLTYLIGVTTVIEARSKRQEATLGN